MRIARGYVKTGSCEAIRSVGKSSKKLQPRYLLIDLKSLEPPFGNTELLNQDSLNYVCMS